MRIGAVFALPRQKAALAATVQTSFAGIAPIQISIAFVSNGEYGVHYIGVNWPHHIFVNKNFKVIGAN